MNRVILLGNLAKDILIRYTKGGVAIATTTIATNKKHKDKSGNIKTETLYIDISFFARSAEIIHKRLKKGSKIAIEGKLVLQSYKNSEGHQVQKHIIEVETFTMLSTRNKDASTEENNKQGEGNV